MDTAKIKSLSSPPQQTYFTDFIFNEIKRIIVMFILKYYNIVYINCYFIYKITLIYMY